MPAEKSSSPWVWVFLILMLLSFAAFIVFLDQKIVNNSRLQSQAPEQIKDKKEPIIDFYTVLPNRKVEITVSNKQQEGIKNPSINKTSGDKILLQVGSFQSTGEADSLKAELAFLGLEAKVTSAVVDNNTWHRVQVGPFASNSALSKAKNLLLENDIEFMQRTATQ